MQTVLSLGIDASGARQGRDDFARSAADIAAASRQIVASVGGLEAGFKKLQPSLDGFGARIAGEFQKSSGAVADFQKGLSQISGATGAIKDIAA